MKKIVIPLFAVLLLAGCGRTPGQYDQLAQCLTGKGVKMYGSDTCPHCLNQKASFKGSFDLITYVECTRDQASCEKAEIMAFPTWGINGKKEVGEKSMSELAELSGCPLTEAAPVDKQIE